MATKDKKAKKGGKPEKVEKKGPPVKKGTFPAKGSGKKKPATKKKPIPTFDAPADFKAHFLLVQVATEADGLFGSKIKAVRYQGKFDREADDKKKFDMSAYDPATLHGIAARLASTTYKATNDKKYSNDPDKRDGVKGSHRLPKKTIFQLLMRIGKRSADNALTARIATVWQICENKKGRMAPVELEKTDPAYRMIRKASRILPAAFANVQMPPKRTRRKKDEDDGDES